MALSSKARDALFATGVVVLGALLSCGVCVAGCVVMLRGEPLPTVDGPEDPSLLEGLTGTLVLWEDWVGGGGLSLVSLPSLEERTLELDGRASAFSELDARGRLVYASSDPEGLELRRVDVETGEEVLLARRWGPGIRVQRVCLAPTGGRVALEYGFDYWRRSADVLVVYEEDGTLLLERWLHIGEGAPSWMPDGRLALHTAAGGRLLDIHSGELSGHLPPGTPVPGPAGFPMLVQFRQVAYGPGPVFLCGDEGAWAQRIDLPGQFMSVVALLDDGRVLYHGLPTTGEPQQPLWFIGKSGPSRKWTLKVACPGEDAFATVLPHVGSHVVSHSPAR